jgi:hypothetical protein
MGESFIFYKYGETMVGSLKEITSIREIIFGIATWKKGISQLNHHLVTIINP